MLIPAFSPLIRSAKATLKQATFWPPADFTSFQECFECTDLFREAATHGGSASLEEEVASVISHISTDDDY